MKTRRWEFCISSIVTTLAAAALVSFAVIAQSNSSNISSNEDIEVARSRLFGGFGTPKTISELLSETSGGLNLQGYRMEGLGAEDPTAPAYPPPALRGIVCTSDLGILGTPGSSLSHVTFDQKFLYTDWTVTVDRVIDNRIATSIREGQTVTVVSPGGKLVLNGRDVMATDRNFEQFKPGEEFVLFLHYISEAAAYKADQRDTFRVTASGIRSVMMGPSYAEAEGQERGAFIRDAEAAAVACGGIAK
jgi:hypothetical protein